MASLAAQIIDQRINGIVERQADSFAAELGLGADAQEQRRSTLNRMDGRGGHRPSRATDARIVLCGAGRGGRWGCIEGHWRMT